MGSQKPRAVDRDIPEGHAGGPIRVTRRGWLKHFHPTPAECRQAVLYAVAEATKKRWEDLDILMTFLGLMVEEQVHRTVWVELAALNLVDNQPFLSVRTEEWHGFVQLEQARIGNQPAPGPRVAGRL